MHSLQGMTLRQYYAAHAPITIRDAVDYLGAKGEINSGEVTPKVRECFARMRFEYADAMIAAEAGDQ